MTEIIWSPTLSVGVDEFDREHRQLIGYINDLREAALEGRRTDALRQTLRRLVDYTCTHFAHEEELLAAHAYPGLAAHKREHDLLGARVRDIQEAFEGGDQQAAVDLYDLLADWLKFHILGTDKAYAEFLRAHGIE
jgi:hemerythrin-like metal-binding protein